MPARAPRPFKVKTHKPGRYEPGQCIRLWYKDTGETQETAYDSIITCVSWQLRGGYTLSCGGEDARVMSDCLRASKADRAIKEARDRCRTLEQRIN